MGIRFSHLKRLRLNFLIKVLNLFLLIFFGLVYSKFSYAAPQPPSQALPKMFQKPPGIDYYQFKKQENIIPEIPQVNVAQQQDTGIKINLKSLIILAPPELQNIIALSRKIANKKNSQSKSEYPSSLAKTEKEEFQKMGAAYIKNTLDQRVTDKPYFIDKCLIILFT